MYKALLTVFADGVVEFIEVAVKADCTLDLLFTGVRLLCLVPWESKAFILIAAKEKVFKQILHFATSSHAPISNLTEYLGFDSQSS